MDRLCCARRWEVVLLLGISAAGIVGCAESRSWEDLNESAKAAHHEARLQDADEGFRAALKLSESFGKDDPRRVMSLNNLGEFKRSLGELDEAVVYYRRALDLREALVGPDNPELGVSYYNLATHYQDLNQLDEARQCYERALQIREQAVGPDHPLVVEALNGLGLVAYFQQDYEKARGWLERAVTVTERTSLADSPALATGLTNLGQLYSAIEEYDLAEEHFSRAERTLRHNFGPDAIRVARAQNNRAEVLRILGRDKEAEQLYLGSLEI